MKRNRPYYFFTVVIMMAMLSCNRTTDSVPSLNETYSRKDKNPFGAYVAFRQVNELFYRNNVTIKKSALDISLADNYSDTSALYICISEHFYLRRSERSALLDFVKRGNNAFVSTKHFDTLFLSEMNVSVNKQPFADSRPNPNAMKATDVTLSTPPFAETNAYGYYYMPLKNSFSVSDASVDVKVLGVNEDGEPDFVVFFFGKGRIYLHCEPRAFSNYFLLKKNNYKYLQYAFSFMPRVPDNIFWDDFYYRRSLPPADSSQGEKNEDSNGKSGVSVLLKYKEMAWAFWLVLLLLALYLLFGSKRRQRIIKPIAANVNTSVAFTETVGRLYLQKKDNRNIADKMITYLLEHIRNQYFISTNNLNSEFTAMVSRKTNMPDEHVQKLFDTVKNIHSSNQVSDDLLLSLNTQIENFYKYK